ncbi:MAG TPA: hypothetical protein VMG60_19990 [Burkholderiaceae bacterium]|nr:hypothetical protein [Burkholderiaceae bacterium]
MKRQSGMLLVTCALLVAACATGGGMYDQPYALIEPHGSRAAQDMRPAFISAIDGVSRDIKNNDPVTPGVHEVEVSVPGGFRMGESEHATIKIDAKPCMRYQIGAKQLSLASRDWSPVIANAEPIGECMKKFPSMKP